MTAFGESVTDFSAYVGGPPGAYAMHRNLPAARAIPVPEDLDSTEVAALIFKGPTVEYLIRRCGDKGHTVLFHAAAGGVRSIACQWLAHIGATVIAR